MAHDWVIRHECGHAVCFIAQSVPVFSIETELPDGGLVRPCAGHISGLDWVTVLVSGMVFQNRYCPHTDERLREAVGGDVLLLLEWLEEDPEKESTYTTALIGLVCLGRIHPHLHIPDAHRKLLTQAVENAKCILEENSKLADSLADALRTKHNLSETEIAEIVKTNKTEVVDQTQPTDGGKVNVCRE